MLKSVAQKLQSMQGWRANVTAFGLGLLGALAFPPFNLIPLLWLCFPALIFLLQGTTNWRSAFARGWSFAFGLLVISLYWIAASMFVDIKSFWWALPFAVAGLPACFACYYGLAAVAARKWGLHRVDGLFFFALCWFLADSARGHFFTGFPWDLMGYVWGDVLPALQITSVIGIEGLTLITLCLAVLPACFVVAENKRNARVLAGLSLAVLVGMIGWGQARLEAATTEMVPNVRLRLVQPRTDQSLKWRPEQRLANFQNIMRLTFTGPAEKPVTHYIWPETAVAYYLAQETDVRRRIAESMGKDTVLLTGVVRREEQEGQNDRYYNSLIAMDARGTIVAGYDKYHLVPFGEYMPHRSVIPFPVISGLGVDFSSGESIRTVRAPNLPPFSPLICYEAIFPNEVVEKEDPPAFLLNVTNDAWYDRTIGPAQHFAIVKVRAIEEGMPLVRVANAGVTGVVDAYGRPVVLQPAEMAGYIDSDLPLRPKTQTLVSAYGYRTTMLLFALFFIVLGFSRLLAGRTKNTKKI